MAKATQLEAWMANTEIESLEDFKEVLTPKQRFKLLAIVLNYPSLSRNAIFPITITEIDELESILKRHLRK